MLRSWFFGSVLLTSCWAIARSPSVFAMRIQIPHPGQCHDLHCPTNSKGNRPESKFNSASSCCYEPPPHEHSASFHRFREGVQDVALWGERDSRQGVSGYFLLRSELACCGKKWRWKLRVEIFACRGTFPRLVHPALSNKGNFKKSMQKITNQ